MANITTITADVSSLRSSIFPEILVALPPLREVLLYLLPLIPVHLLLVRLFRRHSVRHLYRNHPYSSTPNASQKPLSEMPLSSAHDILRSITGTDFPYTHNLGLTFALIRTYAIPSVSPTRERLS